MILILLLVSVLTQYSSGSVSTPASLTLTNHAGAPIELFWVDTFSSPDKELVLQSKKPIRNDSSLPVSSFNTHEFVVKFFNQSTTSPAVQGHFVKGPRDEDVHVHYEDGKFRIKVTSDYDEWVSKLEKTTKKCLNDKSQPFTNCMADDVYKEVSVITEEKRVITKYRDTVAEKFRNYTCADPTLETSPAIATFKYTYADKTYRVDTLLDMPNAKIWAAKNFITDKECDILRESATGKLARATVAGEDGRSEYSIHRRAQQAHYDIPYDEPETDPLWPLYNRIMQFQNQHGKMNLSLPGQEGFTIIQYNPSDEYHPHCDGQCDGKPHSAGGRVSTAVLYCTVPEVGGATVFSKADIYAKPVKNAVTFFVYKGKDGNMDNGFTEHSGCPVLEGEKWISVAWMREGVTRERDWTMIDPSGKDVL